MATFPASSHPLAAAAHWLQVIEDLQQEDGAIGPRERHAQAKAITALCDCMGLPHISTLRLYRFDIPGVPAPRPRPRTGARINKATGKAFATTYQPTKVKLGPDGKPKNSYDAAWVRSHEWYNQVARVVKEGMRQQAITAPLTGCLGCDIEVHLPRPQRLCRKQDAAGPILCHAKPDRDNLEKGITDPMTQAGLWVDDSQVCCGPVRKYYAAIGAAPGVIVHVWPLTTQTAPLIPATKPLTKKANP